MTDRKAGGRVALITDAAHFVGVPAARALIAEGVTVYGVDPSFADAGKREALAEATPGFRPLAAQSPEEAVAAIAEADGRLDVLVNNDAFPALRTPVDEATADDLRRTFEALVFKGFEMARAAVPQMKKQRAGKLLFITSAAPLNGIPNYSIYAAARGAANAFVPSLSRELAPFNIQVNAVAPNYVDNPDYFPPSLMENPEARAKILKAIPLGRLGRPEEAGALIAFLAGPLSDFITGQVIAFAGGWANAR